MPRTYIKDLNQNVGQSVLIKGWVSVRRDQGKMVFLEIRDMSGYVDTALNEQELTKIRNQFNTIQAVILPGNAFLEVGKQIRQECVVEVVGTVEQRPEKNQVPEMLNGTIELKIEELKILSTADTLPFPIDDDTSVIDEEARLRYRYLDLRSERMQRNMRLRSRFVQLCREYLFENHFTEIETPLLTESTPEGSRDFVVPSRLRSGNFYALPQSPQQYKQLLMVGGFERYFQIARCLRDEDLRADRGFEFSQIDIEMSFVEQEDVMQTIEEMMTQSVEAMGFTIKENPFPRFTCAEAKDKFGADKFDLRTDEDKAHGVLAYAWVYKFPFFEKTDNGAWTFTHNPFSMPIPEHVDMLLKNENVGDILTTQYDLVCNGYESAGGSIRAHRPELLKATYEVMGYSADEIEERIGHMLEAFKYGAPPHGGIALGIERNIMNLTGEEYLREVQAFPMTRGGQSAVMKAPKPLTEQQLKELGISIRPPKK
ncbi:MAG TPA: amino acid--tRNA ligase-related protein [Candidatus Paceibacterota bacterium]